MPTAFAEAEFISRMRNDPAFVEKFRQHPKEALAEFRLELSDEASANISEAMLHLDSTTVVGAVVPPIVPVPVPVPRT